MSIGLLLITHNNIGAELLGTATVMLGTCPLDTEVMAITIDCDPDQQRLRAQEIIEGLDQGDGVLILTDMYGSTPSNIACALREDDRIAVVAGINLPMLVRVLNYPKLGLPSIVEKAQSGGHTGIMPYQPTN